MNLASDITCALGGEFITLRPTLRRALRLASGDGFATLIAEIEDESLSAALTVIADNHSGDDLAEKLMKHGLGRLTNSLLAYVLECAGLNSDLDEKADGGKRDGKSVTFEDHLTGLFRIATGWLGWTPQASWDATPAEIIEAYKGRVEMFKAIFGSSEDEPAEPVDTSERFRTVLQSFGTIKMARPS